MFEQIAAIIASLVWPVTLLVIALLFRREIRSIFTGISSGRKNLRLKYGKLELETYLVEELKDHLKKIANEPDPEKRQELSSIRTTLDSSLKKLDEQSKRALDWINNNQLENVTHINWYEPQKGTTRDSCRRLAQFGLIQIFPMYDGDELITIHPLIKDYLREKAKQEEK